MSLLACIDSIYSQRQNYGYESKLVDIKSEKKFLVVDYEVENKKLPCVIFIEAFFLKNFLLVNSKF